MSTVIKTPTPFINKTLLLESLAATGIQHQILDNGNKIIIQSLAAYGRSTYFQRQSNSRYQLVSDSHAKIRSFLKSIGNQYDILFKKKQQEAIEAEKRRLKMAEANRIQADQAAYEAQHRAALAAQQTALQLENERKQYVENQKKAIIQRAEKLGYDVKEIRKKTKVQLVLVRRS